ncbi:dihydrolipoamide acetyltransferase family protein [Aurantiacibacter gangjinensis]|uniref:Dihydrolipoamide acetyltransferase component of pyruvate dehydrogenase complex n=1 Tax=Aurantiacibacter gangjinensis TaxID=502682 RepID=A0A0G9MQC1_9SPHN|nr:dihydrolipoamide acetyltransferase family protein [Aurantiacibacter gangjinensis]APE28574.1 Dihydrolipoamide acyltransferase component of branched-chain alpha-keto acid dehydrogenase complex [Aurantiacibacter gangjinensis]KLE32764.1 branched-chain alpha-keto acid dehydrogenase subunit E2 [Aurantiacibacter gangjinensis]
MAKFTFPMPDIGEGITEAEIVAWNVKVGDRIEEDAEFVDMMTDKATVPMESPVTGKVLEIAGEVGDMVAIGSPLIVIEVEGEVPDDVAEEAAAAEDAAPAPKDSEVETRIEVENPDASDQEDAAATQNTDRAEPVEALPSSSGESAEVKDSPSTSSGQTEKVLATPAVRKRAKDLGVDLAQLKPQADGRVRHADLDSFIAYSGGFSGAAPARGDEEIKVIGLRKRIAENMAAAKRNIPHFTYVEETDVTALEEARAQLNATRGDRPKLTMLPLLITAICKTLPDFPMINARYDDEARVVTRHGAVHLGMATMTDGGLMVPVIRNAQGMNLWQLAREITRLAEAARDGSAKSDELSGSTLTVTSLGPLGGVATTPVINRPEVAIIGPNRIVERPMFVSDGKGGETIAKRKLMNISISCDHRVVDGYDAAAFVQELKKKIEAPATILAG